MKLSNFLLALLILLIMLLVVGVEKVDGFVPKQFYIWAADRTAVVVELHEQSKKNSEILDLANQLWLERARQEKLGISYQTAIISDPMHEVFSHRQNRYRYGTYEKNQRTGEHNMRPMPRKIRRWLA